ncbi:hypothetical protein BS47DRAFT_1173943 [Hydnum rufescens UP504]|uniref:Transcription factor domain-containing protein n=1 Tax=Hydnum rufescens UP504 TaxID=1448309 RepID=A0A9P6AT41_9AGAM|nr:hypothetical protein BS47DRAFT_1173943 [Hydnum rufescens UP504]
MATIEPGQTLISQSFPEIPAVPSDPAEDVTKHLDDPDVRRMIAEQYAPPALILRGIVSPEEVRQLFAIFFERLNPHIEVLRQDIHTIPTLLARCPLLFTVICTLASRYLVSRPDLYPIALSLAKEAISAACFSDHGEGTGSQISADTCLALALFSLWAPPSAPQKNTGLFRDKRWIWAGLSVRMAEELVANLPPAHTAGAVLPLPSLAVSPHGLPEPTSGARHSSDDLFGPTAVLELCRTIDSTWSILRSASFGLTAPPSASAQPSSTTSLSQALEGLRSTMAWSALTRRNPIVEDEGDVVQFAKSLKSQLPHVMGGFMGSLIRSSPLASSASGGAGVARSIQKCLTTLDELGEHARALARRGDISDDLVGINVLCQNILLDICYYRLVVHTLELQTSPEDNTYFSNGLQKRRGRPSKTSKSREPLVST